MGGLPFDMGAPRPFDALVIGGGGGVPDLDLDMIGVYVEDLGNDLTVHGIGPHTVVANPAQQSKAAVLLQD